MPWHLLKSASSALFALRKCFVNPSARYVLRRDPKGAGSVKPGQNPVVNRGPFRPRSVDTDGISVYFAKHVDPMIVASAGQKGARSYYVIRVKIAALKAQGLTLVHKETPDIPGHAVIPELYYGQDEQKLSRWGAAISLTISLGDVFDGATGKWLK